jgi:Tfp pilus assembly PilM family ATPase
LLAAAAAVAPDEARRDPEARAEFMVSAMRQLLRRHPFKGKRVIISMPARDMLIQHMQLARGDDADIRGQIEQQLLTRMNVDPTSLVIRHNHVTDITREGSVKQELICFAAPHNAVMGYINTAQKAKLEVVGMHAEPLAILKAFAHLYRRPDDVHRTTCFIDLGSSTTKVLIAHGGELVFARVVGVGGEHLTKALCKEKALGFSEAREQRLLAATEPLERVAAPNVAPEAMAVTSPPTRPSGFALLDSQVAADSPRDGDPLDAPMPEDPDGAPRQPAAPVDIYGETLDCIIDELSMCLRYHESLFPTRQVEKLVFLGGEAHHLASCQRIAQAVRIGAQLGDPLARLIKKKPGKCTELDLRKPQPGWAVPFGLSISEANL